jgi:hypothetical protein
LRKNKGKFEIILKGLNKERRTCLKKMTETFEEKSVNEKLKVGLKKMVKSFESYIKEANEIEQLEDNLKHMEETDEQFHKLVFTRVKKNSCYQITRVYPVTCIHFFFDFFNFLDF